MHVICMYNVFFFFFFCNNLLKFEDRGDCPELQPSTTCLNFHHQTKHMSSACLKQRSKCSTYIFVKGENPTNELFIHASGSTLCR